MLAPALVAVLVAAVVAGVVATRPDPQQLTVEQDASPAPRAFCEPRAEVAVVDGYAYPPTLGTPAGRDATACFPDVDAAAAAGFPLPPLAAGVSALHGLYLQPAEPYALKLCGKSAAGAGRQMPCPRFLPNGGRLAGCGWCVRNGVHLLHYSAFPAPPEWCDGCAPKLVVTAVPTGTAEDVLALTRCGPAGTRPRRAPPFIECRRDRPGDRSVHAGHTMRRGRARGLTYTVSATGYGEGPRALVDAVFASLAFVDPSMSRREARGSP